MASSQQYSVTLTESLSYSNGIHKIVKNSPFTIKITPLCSASQPLTLSSLSIIYNQPPRREVSLLKKASAVEYIIHNNPPQLNSPFPTLTIECRMFVLSSQHEGETFKLAIKLNGSQEELYTPPFRGVSKATIPVSQQQQQQQQQQQRKIVKVPLKTPPSSPSSATSTPLQSPQTPLVVQASLSSPPSSPNPSNIIINNNNSSIQTPSTPLSESSSPSASSSSGSRKRKASNLGKILTRIEREQQKQRVMIDLLFKQVHYLVAATAPSLVNSSSSSSSPPVDHHYQQQQQQSMVTSSTTTSMCDFIDPIVNTPAFSFEAEDGSISLGNSFSGNNNNGNTNTNNDFHSSSLSSTSSVTPVIITHTYEPQAPCFAPCGVTNPWEEEQEGFFLQTNGEQPNENDVIGNSNYSDLFGCFTIPLEDIIGNSNPQSF